MLLITGTQRSGTSLMADFVTRSGYTMSGVIDEVGKYEDYDICAEYRRILRDPTFPFMAALPDKPVSGRSLTWYDPPVAKFSFMMMNPDFVRIWYHQRGVGRDKFLILVRSAESVHMSKINTPERERIFNTDSSLLKLSPEEIKQNWYDSFLLLLQYKIPFRFLRFPDFLNNYDDVFNALHVWGGLKEISGSPSLWIEMVDKKKVTA